MRRIVYYVASSLDGFISGPADDISGFVSGGNGVEKYLSDLAGFDTVIMGRKTYEFGYKFGLQPGQPAYPHMQHYIFSSGLAFEKKHEKLSVLPLTMENIEAIQQKPGTDIYLCGGGELAGWLLDHGKIDVLKIKLNPLILGTGTRLFGNADKAYSAELLSSETYEKGLQILTYGLHHKK
jgi:dihydrofolate reductase